MRWDRRCWLVVVVLILGTPSAAFSQSGVWTNPLSGLWSAPANWAGGTVANGAGNTADFSTLDIAGDVTVTLDTPRTIGTLLFGDTTPTNNWSISGANTLTLTGGTPTITVNNQSATINSAINFAASGLTKNGAGTLNLTGQHQRRANADGERRHAEHCRRVVQLALGRGQPKFQHRYRGDDFGRQHRQQRP